LFRGAVALGVHLKHIVGGLDPLELVLECFELPVRPAPWRVVAHDVKDSELFSLLGNICRQAPLGPEQGCQRKQAAPLSNCCFDFYISLKLQRINAQPIQC
jgi:hypothetical protein